MSVEREQSITRFTCDGDGCHRNYEGVDGFSSAWVEAKAHGWVNACTYEGNVSTWKHYCSKCKLELGDD